MITYIGMSLLREYIKRFYKRSTDKMSLTGTLNSFSADHSSTEEKDILDK